ncbi:MAG: efflux RND transporter periplasmic adaptor subunit [Chitinispirillia bacterium]|nr:efflux RND transporter periplasmic adaptor subunit [Chitinispirillia bacterium]MCL2241719.1 efflux RND transporter periplasmic adaptor subunit [Chitinispirillia bacterium]
MKKKHGIVLAVFALAGVAVIVVMQMMAAQTKAAAAAAPGTGARGPVAVEVGEASVRPMVDIREFAGTVKASYTYVISAKVGGRLLSIGKRIGDVVRANEMVGRIDDTEYKNALDEAQTQVRVSRASVQEAQAQLSQADRELERARGLVSKGISSQSELDALQTQVETQRSRLELAKAQLEQRQVLLDRARTNFDYTQVRASQPGFVAQRHVDGGTLMSVGGAIITVVGLDTVFVELAVTERDYQSLQPGKAARVTTDAIPGKTFEGVVYRKAPFFQSASRTAAVEIALRNSDMALKPGMFARINITLGNDPAARVVPAAALVEKEGNYSVFVVGDSLKVKGIPVKVGINDGNYAQILSPADLDGQIVTLGQHLLRNGSVVNITAERKSTPPQGKN